jgi:hypothetical protein
MKSYLVANSQESAAASGLFERDKNDLLDVPLNYRWEFTRRHPYYLLLWRQARGYHQNEFAAGTQESEDGLVAMYVLGMIGVTGEPADPKDSFEQLGGLDPAFLSGSVQPMTIRNNLIMLISSLPRAELEVLRTVLEGALNPDFATPGDTDLRVQKRQAIDFLLQCSSPLLDSYPDAPLYYIHLHASQNRIVQDLEVFIRRWKEQRGIPEHRTPITKFPEYLKVWDLREGWNDGSYEMGAEKSLSEVASELKQPKSSVANSYRAAFKRRT